jgi:hypothetical protein
MNKYKYEKYLKKIEISQKKLNGGNGSGVAIDTRYTTDYTGITKSLDKARDEFIHDLSTREIVDPDVEIKMKYEDSIPLHERNINIKDAMDYFGTTVKITLSIFDIKLTNDEMPGEIDKLITLKNVYEEASVYIRDYTAEDLQAIVSKTISEAVDTNKWMDDENYRNICGKNFDTYVEQTINSKRLLDEFGLIGSYNNGWLGIGGNPTRIEQAEKLAEFDPSIDPISSCDYINIFKKLILEPDNTKVLMIMCGNFENKLKSLYIIGVSTIVNSVCAFVSSLIRLIAKTSSEVRDILHSDDERKMRKAISHVSMILLQLILSILINGLILSAASYMTTTVGIVSGAATVVPTVAGAVTTVFSLDVFKSSIIEELNRQSYGWITGAIIGSIGREIFEVIIAQIYNMIYLVITPVQSILKHTGVTSDESLDKLSAETLESSFFLMRNKIETTIGQSMVPLEMPHVAPVEAVDGFKIFNTFDFLKIGKAFMSVSSYSGFGDTASFFNDPSLYIEGTKSTFNTFLKKCIITGFISKKEVINILKDIIDGVASAGAESKIDTLAKMMVYGKIEKMCHTLTENVNHICNNYPSKDDKTSDANVKISIKNKEIVTIYVHCFHKEIRERIERLTVFSSKILTKRLNVEQKNFFEKKIKDANEVIAKHETEEQAMNASFGTTILQRINRLKKR